MTPDAAGQPAAAPAAAARRPRDPRLDFFRGLAMFIILVAHIPGNGWTLWIPARFGWSDATEIFVFCSGMASALAFGGTFGSHGFAVGTARIGYRVWQVYWAHVGLALAVILLMWSVDAFGLGVPGKAYVPTLPIVPFFEDTGLALWGLTTLTWVPNYLDILPMYLVILAMIPAVMAAHRLGGIGGAAALCFGVWLLTQLGFLDLPSRPWDGNIPWFFDPFGWQLAFFTGFALGMGWLTPPRPSRALNRAALAVVLLTIPFAWFRIHDGLLLPPDWAATAWIAEARAATEFLWRKTEFGLFRWLHFLALAWLAVQAVGPRGARLTEGVPPPPAPSRRWLWIAAAAVAVTFPYAWIDEIAALAPGLDRALTAALGPGAIALVGTDLFLAGSWPAMAGVVHAAGLAVLAWAALGPERRERASRRWLVAPVPIIRKVGSQSLAVFLVSMVLAQALGVVLDHLGRNLWTTAVVNLAGFAVLIAVAELAGWYRAQPWRKPPAPSPAPFAAPASRRRSMAEAAVGVEERCRRAGAS